MRTSKKIIMTIVALLPVIALVAYVCTNIGTDAINEYVPMGTVQLIDENGLKIVTEANTWASRLLDPIFNQNALTGVFEALGRMLLFLQDNIGLPISLPVIGSAVLLLYLAWIELISALVDLLTFVPRKCADIFR